MNNFTAQAITSVTGDRSLYMGFDLNNLRPDEIGERKDPWEREVSYTDTMTLSQVLSSSKMIRFDLLVRFLMKDEGMRPDTMVELYSCSKIQEVRLKKDRYRMVNKSYLGKYDKKVAKQLEMRQKEREKTQGMIDSEVND
jgi:hypothetical protein